MLVHTKLKLLEYWSLKLLLQRRYKHVQIYMVHIMYAPLCFSNCLIIQLANLHDIYICLFFFTCWTSTREVIKGSKVVPTVWIYWVGVGPDTNETQDLLGLFNHLHNFESEVHIAPGRLQLVSLCNWFPRKHCLLKSEKELIHAYYETKFTLNRFWLKNHTYLESTIFFFARVADSHMPKSIP
jgi:hypothetical protein